MSHVTKGQYRQLIEPFAGSAAVTLAAAHQKIFSNYLIADRLDPLVHLWQSIIDSPVDTAAAYEALWLREQAKPIDAYYEIRSEFNKDRDSTKLLYLLARCVKNAVRFNPSGDFNQSPDKRREGTRPASMAASLKSAHLLLKDHAYTACADFMDLFHVAQKGDLFYLDPPYQGTSGGRDQRYIQGVSRKNLLEGLILLNEKEIPFILSYDGHCGDRSYGDRLPSHIASRILLDVGRSSQATLNGHNHNTVESLYVSRQLLPATNDDVLLSLKDFEDQRAIAFA